jgi:hypothetical protein
VFCAGSWADHPPIFPEPLTSHLARRIQRVTPRSRRMIPPINFQSAQPVPQTSDDFSVGSKKSSLNGRTRRILAKRCTPTSSISDSLTVLSGFTKYGGGLSDVFITGFTPFGEPLDQSVPLIGNA